MNINLSNKAKIIIGAIAGVLVAAGVIGGSIAIANAVKKNKQSKCEHVYGEGQITAEATCENPGMIVYTCGECDYELTEEIPANGHVNSVIEAIPATCTAKGLTDGIKCVTCEKVLVAPVETPMLGHNVTALKAVAATCTTDGKTEGSKCSRCGDILKAQTVIPAKGHTVVELKGVAPTCTQPGKTNGSKCSACGKVYSAQENIPALGHTVVDGKCTTCGEEGTTPYISCEETQIASGTKAAGSVFRIYKGANPSEDDGYFLNIKADFNYEVDGSTFTANNIYIGVLSNGDFVASFEPMSSGLGLMYLNSQNTTIEFYETEEYYDIVLKQGDTISFNGVSLYDSEIVGTFTLGSTNTVSNFGNEVYILENPVAVLDSE